MVGMTDIAQFLAARLDEDEAAAVRAARPEPWIKPQPSRPNWYVQFWADERDRAAVIADPESSAYPIVATLGYDGDDEADEELAEGRVEHIARHDPARVLAEVKAKRAILAEHAIVYRNIGWTEDGEEEGAELPVCGHCVPKRSHYQSRADVPEGACRTTLLIAAVYADHPDYDPAWRVE